MTHIPAFPLQWPLARPRTKTPKGAQFGTTGANGYKVQLSVAQALERIQSELDKIGAADYVVSTNIALRLDGLPRSGQGEPTDPGAALYFTIKGKPYCLPCDRYDRVADNLAAIAKHMEATRAIERYGVANMAEMYTGFLALPAPGQGRRPWREVMGFKLGAHMTIAAVMDRYRELANTRHQDTPTGSHEKMVELNLAKDDALRELKERP